MPTTLTQRNLTARINQPDSTRIAVDNTNIMEIAQFLPERMYDNPHHLRYRLYNNDNGLLDVAVKRMVDLRLSDPDIGEVTPEMRRQFEKKYRNGVLDDILSTSYTGQEYNDAVFDRMLDLGQMTGLPFRMEGFEELIKISPEYGDLLERDQATGQKHVRFGNRTSLERKIQSDPELQKQLMWDKFKNYERLAEKKYSDYLNPELNRDGYTHGFLLYSRYGEGAVRDYYDFHTEFDGEKDLRGQVPQVLQARTRLLDTKDIDGLAPMDYLTLFYGEEDSPVGVFETTPGDVTDDIKFMIPKDMNSTSEYFYRNKRDTEDGPVVDMHTAIIEMLRDSGADENSAVIQGLTFARDFRGDKQPLEAVNPPEGAPAESTAVARRQMPSDVTPMDYDNAYVHVAVSKLLRDGALDPFDFVQMVAANAQEFYNYGEPEGVPSPDNGVYVLGDLDNLPDHAVWAADVLKIFDPTMFYTDKTGRLVLEPRRQERMGEQFGIQDFVTKGSAIHRTMHAYNPLMQYLFRDPEQRVPVHDKWGNFRKYETEYRGNPAHTLALTGLSTGQTAMGIIDSLGDFAVSWLGSDGSLGDNRLTRSVESIINTTMGGEIPFSTLGGKAGSSWRDMADYDPSHLVTSGTDVAGMMAGGLAGYAVSAYQIGRLVTAGALGAVGRGGGVLQQFPKKYNIQALNTNTVGGASVALSSVRSAKNATNAAAVLKQSRDIQTMAKAAGEAIATNPAWSMPLFTLGYAVTEAGTTHRPHWSMFGSGFIDEAVGYIGGKLNQDWDVNLQARYLSSDATVRYGYDFIGGELLGLLFDGFHGVARYGIGKTFGSQRLRGLDFDPSEGGFSRVDETGYIPFPSWQRAFSDVTRIVREGSANVEMGQLGAAMAKRARTRIGDPFKHENKADAVVHMLEEGGRYFRNMDDEIAGNIRYYDELYGADPRSPEAMRTAVEQVKRDFFDSLGREIVGMLGNDNARAIADMSMVYNPHNLVESGMGRTVFSEGEARRITTDNKNRQYVVRETDQRGPDGQKRFEVFEMENVDWSSDLGAGVYRALGGRTLDQAIDEALIARGIDPNRPGDRIGEMHDVVEQVTNTYGRQVEFPIIDNRLMPGARILKTDPIQTGQTQPFGYRTGTVQGIDPDGRYIIRGEGGGVRRVGVAGADELSTRPFDETVFRDFNNRYRRFRETGDIDPETGLMVGDTVQLYRNNHAQFPAEGRQITALEMGPERKLRARFEGVDEAVPVEELTMMSQPVQQPRYINQTPDNIQRGLGDHIEASLVSNAHNPELTARNTALLRSMGYSEADVQRILEQRLPMSEMELARNARSLVRTAINEGTEQDVSTVALTLREQGYTNNQIREFANDPYREQAEVLDEIVQRHMATPEAERTRGQKAAITKANNDMMSLERARARTQKVVNDTIEYDGRVAEAVPEHRTTTKTQKAKDDGVSKRADNEKQKKADTRKKQAKKASGPEDGGNERRRIESEATYKEEGVATRFKSFIDSVSKIKQSKNRILSVMKKIGGGELTDYGKLQMKRYADARKKAKKPLIEEFSAQKGDVPANTIVRKPRADGTGEDFFIRTQKPFAKGDSKEPSFFTKVIRDGDESVGLHINEHWRPINRNVTLTQDGVPRGYVRVHIDELNRNFGPHGFGTDDVVVRPTVEGETPEFFVNIQRPIRAVGNERQAAKGVSDTDFAIRADVDAVEYRSETSQQPYYRIFSKHQMVGPEKFDAELDVHKIVPELDNYMGPDARKRIGYGLGIGAVGLAMDQLIDFDNELNPSMEAGLGGMGLIALAAGVGGRGMRGATRRASNAVRDAGGGSASSKYTSVHKRTVEIGRQQKLAEDLLSEGLHVGRIDSPTKVQSVREFGNGLATAMKAGKDGIRYILDSSYFQSNQRFLKKLRLPAGDKIADLLQTVNVETNRLISASSNRFNNKHGPGAMQRYLERGIYEDGKRLLGMTDDQATKELVDQSFGALMDSKHRVVDGRVVITEYSPAATYARERSSTLREAMDVLSQDGRFADLMESIDVGLFRKVKAEFDEQIRRGITEAIGENAQHLDMPEHYRTFTRSVYDETGRLQKQVEVVSPQQYREAAMEYLSQNNLTIGRFIAEKAKDSPNVAQVLRMAKNSEKGDPMFSRAIRYREAGNSFTDLSGRYVPHIVDYRKVEARRGRYVKQRGSEGVSSAVAEKEFDNILQNEWREINEQKFFKGRKLRTMEDGDIAPFRTRSKDDAVSKLKRVLASHEDADVLRQLEERIGAFTTENLERAGFIKRGTQTVKKKNGEVVTKEYFELEHPENLTLTTGSGADQRPFNIFENEHNLILKNTFHKAVYSKAVKSSNFLERPREYEMPLHWRVNSPERILNSYTHDVGTRMHFLKNNILDDLDFNNSMIAPVKRQLAERMRAGGSTMSEINETTGDVTSHIRTIFDQITGVISATRSATDADDAYNIMLRQRRTERNYNTFVKPLYGMAGYGFSFLDTWQTWITTGVYTSMRQTRDSWGQAFRSKQFVDDLEGLAREANIVANKADNYFSEFDRFNDPSAIRGDAADVAHFYANKVSDAVMRFSFTRAIAPVFGADVSNFGAFRLFTDGLIGMNQLNTSINMHAFLMESQRLARAAKALEQSGQTNIRLDGEVYTMGRIRRQLEQLGVPNDDRSFRIFVDGETDLMRQLESLGTGERVRLENLDPEHNQIVHKIITNSAETYHGLNKMNYPQKWGTPFGRLASTFLRFGYNIGLQTTQNRVRRPMTEWLDTFSGKNGNPDLNTLMAGEVFYHYNRQDWTALRSMGLSEEAINAFPAEAFGTVHRMFYGNGINVAGFMTLGVIKDIIAHPFNEYSDNTQFYSLILNPYAPQDQQVSLLDLFSGDARVAENYVELIRYLAGKSGLYAGVGGGYMESAAGYGVSRMRVSDFAPPSAGIYGGMVNDLFGYIRSDYSDIGEWMPSKTVNDILRYSPITGSRMVPRRAIQDAIQTRVSDEQGD